MIIGVPKEVKDHETRVALTPAGVKELKAAGHSVLVEQDAGELSAFPDEDYQNAGAEIVGNAGDVWAHAEMVCKVKEPVEKEYVHFRPGLTLFTYLHLAPLPELTERLLTNKVTGIAYETVRDHTGTLPLLTPMSEVAGRLSVQVGAAYLEKSKGGRGLLLGGVPGVPPAEVCILGGGIVGTSAARIALGMGARVTIIDRNLHRLREIEDIFNGRVFTLASNLHNITEAVRASDLVIGGILIPGAAAPRIVTAAMVKNMKRGSVLVDVAIDQGGCFETARPTTHSNPSYEVDGVVHYCVTNMPYECDVPVCAEAGCGRKAGAAGR
jgi:alanine dehydrogenase